MSTLKSWLFSTIRWSVVQWTAANMSGFDENPFGEPNINDPFSVSIYIAARSKEYIVSCSILHVKLQMEIDVYNLIIIIIFFDNYKIFIMSWNQYVNSLIFVNFVWVFLIYVFLFILRMIFKIFIFYIERDMSIKEFLVSFSLYIDVFYKYIFFKYSISNFVCEIDYNIIEMIFFLIRILQ